ncbi:hypothetical protein [Streptacidiphilus sp. PAMC 29251]
MQVVWPIGTVCNSCYERRRSNPMPCSACGTTRVLVGRAPAGGDLCGPCSGEDTLDFACRRCAFPGDIYKDGNCARCVLSDRVHDLLGHEDGAIPHQLSPLAERLIAAVKPKSVLGWLRRSPSARLLIDLAAQRAEITHELLDGLPQDPSTRYIREVLVAAKILPTRQENLARLELWLDSVLAALPRHQLVIIRPFAEWSVVRDARRRAARGRYTAGAATADRVDIRVAIEFLNWLDTQDLNLGTLTQSHVDLWIVEHPTRFRGFGSFIRWTSRRRLTSKINIPTRKHTLAAQFHSSDEHHEQLRRCLNDDAIPLELRVSGALVRLYALPVTRIVELTTDKFHRDDTGAYLTFDRHPVLLPPKLARLVEQQIARPSRTSTLQTPSARSGFLLPGKPPSRPRNAAGLQKQMRQHGLPVIAARNTAMIEAATDLPPIVISDLFGLHPSTAHAWAQYANDSWADYLAACQDAE